MTGSASGAPAPRLRSSVAIVAALLVGGSALAACSGVAPSGTSTPPPAIVPEGAAGPSNLRLVLVKDRPRLTLLTREGDPAPAMVAVVATDLGSAQTVALSALVEARLVAAGLPVDTRADRGSFRVRLFAATPQLTPKAFFDALARAFEAKVARGAPELAKVAERLAALKRNPLPAAEMAPAADCTGLLGIVPKEKLPDPQSDEGVAALEKARATALTIERTALAIVGPEAFCAAAESALTSSSDWQEGPPIVDAWPAGDSVGTYAANDVAKGRSRITVAARVADAPSAVSAASRLGDDRGALRARLSALPLPFRVTEVTGVAHPRGGCVAVTAEADAPQPGGSGSASGPISASAIAAAILRKEIVTEAHAPADPGVAARAVLSAADPRDAAAIAAWWTLSTPVAGAPDRIATALALPPDDRGDLAPATKRFEADLASAWAASEAVVAERRSSIEKGQGEVWILLASPCGTIDEGPYDAGSSALGALAVVADEQALLGDATSIEPWITADGVGVIAHAAAVSSPPEDEAALARRVASAAARAFAGEVPNRQGIADARATAIAQIERTAGPHGAAMEGLLGALAPDHPAQLYPIGPFSRVAALSTSSVTSRWQSLATGPLRMALLANGGAPQANAAFERADHWLAPRPSAHACPVATESTLKPGHYEVDLPSGVDLAQALVAAPVAARGQAGRDLAEVAAHLLSGDRGLAQAALDKTSVPATATARLLGGGRAAALVIDVRAPASALDDAVNEVKALLTKLGQEGPPDASLDQARAKKARAEEAAALDPRARLVKLWLGDPPRTAAAPSRTAMQTFFATTFRDTALTVVAARHK
ncbi:MAG: hypothetical protein U0441_29905 [Polyangiaceae bacterium]